MKISILGTEYSIETQEEADNPKLKDADGYCDPSVKKIVIRDIEKEKADPQSKENLEEYRKKVTRHEIIHAMFYESGLAENSGYGNDETLVDWIAIQFLKLEKAFTDAKVL